MILEVVSVVSQEVAGVSLSQIAMLNMKDIQVDKSEKMSAGGVLYFVGLLCSVMFCTNMIEYKLQIKLTLGTTSK